MRSKGKSPKKADPRPRRVTVNYVVNNMKSKCSKGIFLDIRRLQKSTNLLIPKLTFSRLIHEILNTFPGTYRVQAQALEALQEAAEMYLVDVLSDANRCCAHAKRATLFPSDLQLVLDLRGVKDPGFCFR